MWPDNVHETGVSPGGRSDPPSWPPRWSRSSESAPLSTDISDDAIAPGADGLEAFLTEAMRAGVISSADAVLLRTTRETIGEVRERLGIKLAAAQQRRHRARGRLLDWLADPS